MEQQFKFELGEKAIDFDTEVEIVERIERGEYFEYRKQYRVEKKIIFWSKKYLVLEEFLSKKNQ